MHCDLVGYTEDAWVKIFEYKKHVEVLFRWMEWNEPLHPCLSPYPLKSTIWVQLKSQELLEKGSLVFKNYERQDATLLSWNLMFIIFVYIFLVCIAIFCRRCPLICNVVLGYIVRENLLVTMYN
uniref:Uncharacterized protein n=1 Tax=Lactuca sativa TaxID=4236 RepID=A0A9R1XD34_LACSA|nr:hypothetical protein LSAT_V11C500287020 [Lactuca sativa]